MKRAAIATLLGITVFASNGYSQGEIIFSNYISSTLIPVVLPGFGPVTASQGVSAELYYGLGAGLSASLLTPLPASITQVGIAGPGVDFPGAIIGPAVVLPNWTSGPVTFGISFIFPGGFVDPYIVTWTEPASTIAPVGLPAGHFTLSILQQSFPSGIYIPIPEPGTLAISLSGALAILTFLRRRLD